MKKVFLTLCVICIILTVSCSNVQPPEPYGPLPSERQLAWHDLETYLFVHFTVNTFTDKEWGYGDESPKIFNPAELDCRQWAKAAKDAGMKGIIITAKHHDGFCLWPSKYTEHSVKNSPWRDGKGDVLRELRKACDEYGLKMGVYLSPWDRNSACYGTPEYVTYYRNQLRELLTQYGDIFEVWFDGANGGDGYYGGKREKRTIDRKTYYDWPNTHKIVRELQPNAIMFSDAGPDCRWCGNESGLGSPTNWCLLKRDEMWPGGNFSKILGEGHSDGTFWVPAEVDVSIRPGWFYHESQDMKVRTPENLLKLYYQSVGRNSSFLLNIPPDKRGLFHENDVKALLGFKKLLDKEFSDEIKPVKASSKETRGKDFKPLNIIDNDPATYWAAKDGIKTASIVFDFGREVEINRILLQEEIKLGQRIFEYSADALVNGRWVTIDEGTTIGHKIIKKFPLTKTDRVRLNIKDSKACPVLANIKFYKAPERK